MLSNEKYIKAVKFRSMIMEEEEVERVSSVVQRIIVFRVSMQSRK